MKKKETIEEQYQKVTQYEHILKRPDSYIGSIEFQKERLWVYNSESEKLEFREVKYVPGLFKIFDEILVNAADNYQNDKTMKYIKVDIDRTHNRIKIKNGGRGIPISIHKTYNMYVPQLIFGNLLTSSNYNDNVKKVTGGRNGYGAKLTNIYSKTFIVETAFKETGKKYYQKFYNNMLKFNEPEIEDYSKDDFTCITFEPDLARFGMDELDDDIVALFEKRVFDMAGITPKSVSVYLNGKKLKVKNFEDYIRMYLDASKEEDEIDPPIVYESPHPRWEVGMSLSESQFQQVSFVNAISTTKGGKHVDYCVEKIIKVIQEKISKKEKNLNIKPQHIKQHLWIFVNCLIENPVFSSQTKETLTSKKEDFGSEFEFSDTFLKNVLKTNIVERCLRYAKTREEEKNLRKLNSGTKKTARLIGIEKLDDANWAGTKNSSKCTLILTEGDSAKSLAMAGIEVVGRDAFGCFPLRGKLLNVRECSTQKILKNQEIQYLMKILGIKIGETYTDVKSLRYGSILIMTDQDVDGSHIKGLIINFIHTFWPSLIKLNGFMRQFITPILKASKGKEVISFYTIPEYEEWVKSKKKQLKGWKIKYYKGLGTSSNKEAQEYFANIQRHRIDFEYKGEKDDESIDMAFNKKKTEERKNWLMNFDPNTPPLNLDVSKISYDKFINRELILFSLYDNQRSIPSVCDGLKPSERKILYGCFKKNLREEIKVAQLVGYISEHTAYKHGEQSLAGTIVAMAQNFVGSNNINLLMPNGQFGTRNKGGKDCASSRYIFTELNKVTRHLFNQNDSPLMDYIFEEGQKIEPKWYLPIIPMILVNGCEGIGTGWRSQLPCFNPHEIIKSLKSKLQGNNFIKIEPWYKGYQGEIKENPQNKGNYIVTGKYHWDENNSRKVIITEIPIKTWTENYKYFLQELMGIEIISRNNDESKNKKKGRNKSKDKSSDEEDKSKKKKKEIIVEDIRENHTYNRVCFEVTLLEEYAEKFKNNDELFIKTFNLQSNINIKNMVLFSPEGKLKKYNTIEEILQTFYDLRLTYYQLRKDYMISVLKKEVATLSNKARFIKMVIEDELIIKKKKRILLVNELYDLKFDTQTMLNEKKQKTKEEINRELELQNNGDDNQNGENNSEEEDSVSISTNNQNQNGGRIKPKVPIKEYDYLLNMNLWSLTYEKIEELLKQKEQKEKELSILEQTTIEKLWSDDLDNLEEELTKYEEKEEEDRLLVKKLNKGKSGAIPKRRRGGRKKKNVEENYDNNSQNGNNSENSDSNNTSLISNSTDNITKNKKNKKSGGVKNKKNKKKDGEKNQINLDDMVNSIKKEKTKKTKKSNTPSKSSDSVSKNSKSNISNISSDQKESSDDDNDESKIFKIPLKERLKKRNINIGESPLPLDNFNYGPNIKRDLSEDDFSDFDMSYFDNKEKVEE